MIRLPENPLRFGLHDEINAHPYEPLHSPERITYLAFLVDEEQRACEGAHAESLCRHLNLPAPDMENRYIRIVSDGLRVKIERHEEFTRYSIILYCPFGEPFAQPAACRLPAEWIEAIPGTLLVAANAAVILATNDFKTASPEAAAAHFPDGRLIGSGLANGALTTYTDFRIHEDGFSHWLVYDHCQDPNQVGRTLQRLLEVETYRMLALLAVPIVRDLRPELKVRDRQLVELTNDVAGGSEQSDDDLLEDLTRLAADIEHLVSTHQYRFDATRAYFGLVSSRLAQLREVKIGELATLSGYLNRRLEPIEDSCESSMRWLNTLAHRVTNASQMLRTRADVRREQQNLQLLAALNRRSGMQLRLQQTVEAFSLAAITYAGAQLLGIMAGALFKRGLFPFDEPTMQAIAIPVVFLLAYWGTASIRRDAALDTA